MDLFKKRIKLPPLFQQYNKVVVIVGGSGRVGKALLGICASLTDIVFVIVSPTSTVSSDNIISIRADMTKEPEIVVKKILSLTGRVDVLVHMAATYAFDTAESLSLVNLRKEFEVNTFMPLLVTQELVRQQWSKVPVEENRVNNQKVVIIGSQAGNGKTKREELITYSATKAALAVGWEYYADFLNTKGVKSIFLKPGGLQEQEALDSFVQELKTAILS